MVEADRTVGQRFHFVQGSLKQLLQRVGRSKFHEAKSSKLNVFLLLALSDVHNNGTAFHNLPVGISKRIH